MRNTESCQSWPSRLHALQTWIRVNLPFSFAYIAAPLSDEKKTKVFLSMPKSFSVCRMMPTPSSSSRTASPYLRDKRIQGSANKTLYNYGQGHLYYSVKLADQILTILADWCPGRMQMHIVDREWSLEPSKGRMVVSVWLVCWWSWGLPKNKINNGFVNDLTGKLLPVENQPHLYVQLGQVGLTHTPIDRKGFIVSVGAVEIRNVIIFNARTNWYLWLYSTSLPIIVLSLYTGMFGMCTLS